MQELAGRALVIRHQIEHALTAWRQNNDQRDALVLAALAAGVTKQRVYRLTGISRSTIDRIEAGLEKFLRNFLQNLISCSAFPAGEALTCVSAGQALRSEGPTCKAGALPTEL